MRKLKPTVFIIFGPYGSGKTNVLFKLAIAESKNTSRKPILISANNSTLGQKEICEKFCSITNITFIQKTNENFPSLSLENAASYFIDIGGSLEEQKKSYSFFTGLDCEFIPIVAVPSYIDFSILKKLLSSYSFLKFPKVIFTFCDYVPNERIEEFKTKLNEQNIKVIGCNSSFNLSMEIKFL